jgi:hypothetical protein
VKRDADTQAMVDAAREEPTDRERDVERMTQVDAALGLPKHASDGRFGNGSTRAGLIEAMLEVDHALSDALDQHANAPTAFRSGNGCKNCDANSEMVADGKMLILRGPELAAYRQLQAAAQQAQIAQSAMATSGGILREAIQGLCAVIAPGTKP